MEATLLEPEEYFQSAEIEKSDPIGELVAQYRAELATIESVVAFTSTEVRRALGYFLDGNKSDFNRLGKDDVERLFRRDGAVAALNADYWKRAMDLTDVLSVMPQKRRDEWQEQIAKMKCPAFDETTVRETFGHLFASRATFLAERVDGIFYGLSRSHVTNKPEGFRTRMIVEYVLNEHCGIEHRKSGLINDLRCVIAKFMGRDQPRYTASQMLMAQLKDQWGEWCLVDGGALKIRLYKKGTAHMEIHPDMAWRLNQVLASLHPHAIPAEHREKPLRKAKAVNYEIARPLPFAVLDVLAGYDYARVAVDSAGVDRYGNRFTAVMRTAVQQRGVSLTPTPKSVMQEAATVLQCLGGTWDDSIQAWNFGYDPLSAIRQVINSGCVPDQKSHQFYPTPPEVAAAVVELAGIQEGHRVLEPSAGNGALADLVGVGRITCVELAELRATILKAKGHAVICDDFLAWAGKTWDQYDRIVMNPPFSEGRWRAHLEAAAARLAPGGRIVAVLPVSSVGKDLLPGLTLAWPRRFDGAFEGTQIPVVIVTADKPRG